MSLRLVTVLLLALALATPAVASERQPTLAEIEREVMCPTCHTLLELSSAPIAERMRAFIRTRIADGDSKSEIKTRLVAEFGPGVLAAPPAHGFGLLAWLLPIAGLLGSASVVAAVAWRWRRADVLETVPAATQNGSGRLDPALERRLERELAQFDR